MFLCLCYGKFLLPLGLALPLPLLLLLVFPPFRLLLFSFPPPHVVVVTVSSAATIVVVVVAHVVDHVFQLHHALVHFIDCHVDCG